MNCMPRDNGEWSLQVQTGEGRTNALPSPVESLREGSDELHHVDLLVDTLAHLTAVGRG